MMASVLLVLLGFVMIAFGGDWFVGGAVGVARRYRVPHFVIGATIVSVGTTLPELVTSGWAAFQGKIDMAIGNAVGSASANIALVLGIGALAMPMALPARRGLLWKGGILLAAVAALWLFAWTGFRVSIVESVILTGLFAVFIVENVLQARTEGEDASASALPGWKYAVRMAVGLAGILLGAWLLVTAGCALARHFGVTEGVIGLSIIALGTSLPELVTHIVALRQRNVELAVGNAVGASIINIALIVPLCGVISGTGLPVTTAMIPREFAVCLALSAVALLPTLLTGKTARWQGLLLVVGYLAYMATLFLNAGVS
ncbi:MAG: calcium/sodium antiporter [Kiritimatiellaeota bacterium]|nr:calcium/sodium antiporter [Kiritimatiellota bacterium]